MSEFEHPEPIFKSTPGETPAPKIQKYLDGFKAGSQDEIPTAEDLTETDEMKDLGTVNEIMQDEKMGGIFAFLINDKFTMGATFSYEDISKFRELYPQESNFDDKARTLDKILTVNEETGKEWRQAESRLKDLLYPKA